MKKNWEWLNCLRGSQLLPKFKLSLNLIGYLSKNSVPNSTWKIPLENFTHSILCIYYVQTELLFRQTYVWYLFSKYQIIKSSTYLYANVNIHQVALRPQALLVNGNQDFRVGNVFVFFFWILFGVGDGGKEVPSRF